jgi:hypothetical protein
MNINGLNSFNMNFRFFKLDWNIEGFLFKISSFVKCCVQKT